MLRRLWCFVIGKRYDRDLLMEKRRAARSLGIRTLSIDEIKAGLDKERATSR